MLAGHAIELAKQYTEEGWVVVGSGGDGSACELIQGVKAAERNNDQPCGFVGAGSMNFFSVSAGIESPVKVIESLPSASRPSASAF